MGIGKRQLLEDYYMDEIPEIARAWRRQHGLEEETQQVDELAFLGGGGEVVE